MAKKVVIYEVNLTTFLTTFVDEHSNWRLEETFKSLIKMEIELRKKL